MRSSNEIAEPITYEAYPVRTHDGFELMLYRSRPTVASLTLDKRPVLLLPGANSNRFTFGVVDGLTLPASLNAAGRDVWLLDFRGSRSSTYLRSGKPVINLDRKLDFDLPAAIDLVLKETQAERVDLVGHSLGGVLGYCFCAGPGAERIGRMVTLASPASFEKFFGLAARVMHHPTRLLAPVAQRLRGIGIDRAARMPGPLPHAVAMNNHLRLRTLTRAQRRAWLTHGIEDMSGGDLSQLMRWITTGRYVAADGRDRGRDLASIRTPTLVIRVEGDGLVPGASVTDAYERLGTEDKAIVVIGKAHGATRNYRHADILLAPSAVYDVHPHVVSWLNKPASAATGADAQGSGDQICQVNRTVGVTTQASGVSTGGAS
jgi:pimeloyl-ACP methyl ester carboxylesterase